MKVDYLNSLETLLHFPLFDATPRESQPKRLLAWIYGQEGNEFGLLVRIEDHPGILKKLTTLIFTAIQLRHLSKALQKQGYSIEKRIGIYPDIGNPVTVFQLGTAAESYVNSFVLPAFPEGWNGKIRKCIMKLIQFHPSVAGLILVTRKA